MIILHIIIDLDVGGAELLLKRLIGQQIRENLNQHIVISLTGIGEVGLKLQSSGTTVMALEMHSIADIPRIIWRLKKLIQQEKPDVVQTWMYHADLLGGLAARLAGQKNIIWGVRATFLSRRSHSTRLIRTLCARFSHWLPKKIICVAEAARRSHADLGYDDSRMVVIPNGFDCSALMASRKQGSHFRKALGVSATDLVIGCVGRFHQDKGQDLLIGAAAIILHKRPDIRFILVGRGCDCQNTELLAFLNDTGVRDHFILLGERDDVPVCLAAMDIFCMPSRTEGFPNGLGEAMAAELPCVATKVGDAALLVGDAAVLTEVGEKELADGIFEMLRLSTAERIRLGRQAGYRVKHEFSMEKVSGRFNDIYQQVINHPSDLTVQTDKRNE